MKVEFTAQARRMFESQLDSEQQRAVEALISRIEAEGDLSSDTALPPTVFGPAWRHRAGQVRVLVSGEPADDIAWVLGFGLRPAA